MRASAGASAAPNELPFAPALLFTVALSVVAGLTAVSTESLWIDEANSALKAIQPDLTHWWQALVSDKGSDLQMPLFMLYLWSWVRLAGQSEFALRAANIAWFCAAQFALVYALRKNSVAAISAVVLGAVSPFLWFYLNEARPYVMQYSASCFLCAVLFRATQDPASGLKPMALWTLGVSLIVLCGSSLLGVIWAAFAGAAWLYLVREHLRRSLTRESVLPVALTAASLLALAAYYVWSIRAGARASEVGRTGFPNLAFVLYELLGIAGLGPGRLAIRQHGLDAFRDFSALRVPLAIGLLLSLCRVWKHPSRRAVIAGCIYVIPPSVLLLTAGYAQNFRVLGRHFMPLMPVVIGLFALGISEMRHRKTAWLLFAALVTTWLGSSLSLRFAARHRKDDYRAAASVAKEAAARNESVWWSADRAAAIYYEVPLGSAVQTMIHPSTLELTRPEPDVVITSKPDIYDPTGDLAAYLREHAFVHVRDFPAFAIWRRPAPALR